MWGLSQVPFESFMCGAGLCLESVGRREVGHSSNLAMSGEALPLERNKDSRN